MDKNSIIGLALIGLLLVGYSIYTQPSDEEIAEQQRVADSLAVLQVEEEASIEAEAALLTEVATADTSLLDSASIAELDSELKARYGVLAPVAAGEEIKTTIKTDVLELTFSNKGGVPVKANLLDYSTYDSLPLVLFDEETAKLGYEFTYPSLGNLNTSDFYFAQSKSDFELSGEDSKQIAFTLNMEGGRKIENIYTVNGNSYEVGIETRFTD
ncbi:MAG: membrane protein insertase YidC, partial [Bacteroidota bacterium]